MRHPALPSEIALVHRLLWRRVRPRWLPNAAFGHGPDHAIRAYRHGLRLGHDEEACLLVVGAACLLMDSGLDISAGRTGHVERSAAIGRSLCEEIPQLSQARDQIVAAIESHEGDGVPIARSREAIVVRDSDTLDRLGFSGIRMTLLYGAWIGRSAFHPRDPLCLQREPDLECYTLDYVRYLDALSARVVTSSALSTVASKRLELEVFWRELERRTGPEFPANHSDLLSLVARLRSGHVGGDNV